MIPAGIFLAFLTGLGLELAFVVWSDRRAIRQEAEWWEELKVQALDNYGRVFDWEELGDA